MSYTIRNPRHRSRGESGFTLIELLVVIIIIAVLAAIAIPTYLGARGKAQDNAAVSLVRNGLTIVESAYVEKRDYTQISAADLTAMEPSITWAVVGSDLVDATGPVVHEANITAQVRNNQVNYYPQSATMYDLASESESGNYFAIEVQTTGSAGASYVKVRVIEGETDLGW